MKIIEVENLTKEFKIYRHREGLRGAVKDLFSRNYQTFRAVDNLDLQLEQGEMLGFIGANGAGKSTTIKMLTGILVPSSGKIQIAGFNPHAQRVAYTQKIGVVFGQRSQLWWDLAVVESFRLLQKIYRVPDKEFKERLERFNCLLGMDNLLHLPVRKLSLGQRMRCELAGSLLHNPSILFLDEPTIGLDVLAKVKIREFLQEINCLYKTTVILTTHDLGDIEALCPRVAIVDRGKKVYDGKLAELHNAWGAETSLEVQLREELRGEDWRLALGDLPVSWEQSDETTWLVRFSREEILPAQVISAVIEGLPVEDLNLHRTTIEETVRKIYQKQHEVKADAS